MLERLEEAIERERRFVDDASHELRTPLANLKAELDLALRRSRTADELERALRSAGRRRTAWRGWPTTCSSSLEPIAGGSRSGASRWTSLGWWAGRSTPSPLARPNAAWASTSVCPRSSARTWTSFGCDRRSATSWTTGSGTSRPAVGCASPQSATTARYGSWSATRARASPRVPPRRVRGVRASGRVAFEARRRTGLGLAIVAAVAEAHGGTAEADNLPGGGAVVVLSIPS